VIWAAAVAALLLIVAALGYQLQTTRRAAVSPTRMKLAALQGGTIGNVVGSGLVDVINRSVPGVRLEMIDVPAIRAIRDLDAGQVQFAITTNLLAFHAVKTDQLLGHRSDAIAALTTAWAAPAQIVVRSDSDVKTIADLKGKRISLDLGDAGARFCSQLLLSHAGLNSTDVLDQFSDMPTSLEQMRQGRLDAYITWRGLPIPQFTDAFASGKFRLISLDPELLRGLRLKHPFLTTYTLPPRLYPHQEEPVVTVSSSMLLVASRSLPDDVVGRVMTAIAGHLPDLIARHPAAADIQIMRRPTIDDGLSIDLHPGAERFFESVPR
jgi:TRAP transporter TAXI family solute receptor